MTAEAERTGPITISRELFDFLMGAGGIDGVHFGEEAGDPPGRFWWRKELRVADDDSNAAPGDIAAAIEPIRHWYDDVDHRPRPLVDVVTDMAFDIQADRKLLINMRAALLAQDAAEARRAGCRDCAVHSCLPCEQAFGRAADLRRVALSTLDEDAARYLSLLDLSTRVSAEIRA